VQRDGAGLIERFRWIIDGSYFDVRELRDDKGARLEASPGDVQPRYLIELNVKATDRNFDTGPKSAVNAEPIRLLVVSPSDLLYEISKDEEVLGTKLDEAIRKVDAAKKKYEFVRSKNGFAGLDEVDPVKVRSRDASQDVNKAMEIVQTILREYRRIEKECIYNQLDDKNLVHYGVLANRLDRVLGESPFTISREEELTLAREQGQRVSFPIVDKLMTTVQTALEGGQWADSVLVSDTEIAITRLREELFKIRQDQGEGESFDKVKREFNVLLEQQRRVRAEINKWYAIDTGTKFQITPKIGPVGAVFLVKGESKKIQHEIKWRQYKEDTLVVKLTSSDPTALVVPEELKLDFEKNDLNFDYEIRAANKPGDYTITLTPASGEKVEVKVTVK
jgi:hypothetical protein